MADVKVRSLTVFYGSAEGRNLYPGDQFTATEGRASELLANGLVERIEEKATAKTEPKAEAKPDAKAKR